MHTKIVGEQEMLEDRHRPHFHAYQDQRAKENQVQDFHEGTTILEASASPSLNHYHQFMQGLQEIADKRGISLDDLQGKILKTGGPKTSSNTVG